MVRKAHSDPDDIDPKQKELILAELEICAKDPIYWFEHWCYTWDPHDRTVRGKKKFPSPKEAPWLYKLVETLVTEKRVLVPKSRQMMVSWTVCAFILWDTQFHTGTRSFMTSKKEADADKLVQRCKFMYKAQIESQYWGMLPKVPSGAGADIGKYCELSFPEINSLIQGLSQGSEAIRMETASNVFSDEMAFQDQSEADFKACMPTLGTQGRYIGVSSPNGKNFFWRLCFDRVD